LPHSVFVCFVQISQQIRIISLKVEASYVSYKMNFMYDFDEHQSSKGPVLNTNHISATIRLNSEYEISARFRYNENNELSFSLLFITATCPQKQ